MRQILTGNLKQKDIFPSKTNHIPHADIIVFPIQVSNYKTVIGIRMSGKLERETSQN